MGTQGSPNMPNRKCEYPRLTKHHVYNGLGRTCQTKLYTYNGLRARGSPDVTYTMVWECMTYQTLQIHLLVCPWLTKRYIYNGVGAHCSPNLTNTLVLISMAHPTFHIQRFATHGSPTPTNTIVFIVFILCKCSMLSFFNVFRVSHVFHVFIVFLVFLVSHVFH